MRTASFDALRPRSLRPVLVAAAAALLAWLSLGASTASAASEAHPLLTSFGSFTDPNGIAVEESTGDVYVADIATGTVSKFDADGNPVEFSTLHSNVLSGAGTPSGSFSFPNVYGTPAAVVVDNSAESTDPSRGDLYVLDAGHNVIDKFKPNGEYLSQITGPFEESELLGLAVDARGNVRVGLWLPEETARKQETLRGKIALFDNSAENEFIKNLEPIALGTQVGFGTLRRSFAVGPTGDPYLLIEGSTYFTKEPCDCIQKLGNGALAYGLGLVDNGPGDDVAMAVDPVSGHLYVDDQSSVVEWDTGGMDGYERVPDSFENEGTAALLSRFGSSQLSGVPEQQGGIAVNGTNGEIYVSNPADGKVYAFGSTVPAVAAGKAANVTQTGATLQGGVDPRGAPVSSCLFEYEKAAHGTESLYFEAAVTVFLHSVPCAQSAAQIGSGSSPVAVSAEISGLEPGVLYYFRLAAANANGTSSSEGMFAAEDSGFGIKGLSVSFLNQDGTPDTQAGSHPYEVVTSFTFNTKAEPYLANGAESPYRLMPTGSAKDIIFTPPPGLIGNPNATQAKCTIKELEVLAGESNEGGGTACPAGSEVGTLYVETPSYGTGLYTLYNMVPPHGVAAQFGAHVVFPDAFINIGLQAGGQYPVQAESQNIPAIEPVFRLVTTLHGVIGSGETRRAFVTLPTGCTGPLHSSVSADSYEHPGHFVTKSEITRNSAGEPVVLTGCSKLTFPAAISAAPDVSNASSSSGLTVGVHTPQTGLFNPEGLAESALRNTVVALPAGVVINPSGGDGLQGCSEALAGFTGFKEFNPEFEPGVNTATFTPAPIESLQPGISLCPDQSKIGTVRIKTPLLPNDLEGAVYLASQEANPFGTLIAMYMMFEDPVSGSTVKLAGEVRLCESPGELISGISCEAPGQLIANFKNTPDLPFEVLELRFFGGERAPLSTPAHCGTYTTRAVFSPWDGNAPVETSSPFVIDHGPGGGPCPGQSLPFEPDLTSGTTSNQAGGFTPFTLTMSRADGEQNLDGITIHLPPGLLGTLTGVTPCSEPQADEGTCGPQSLIGETTVSVGVGSAPFTVKGGKVYLTGPYKGAPYGLSIVNPAKAGPFDLENTARDKPPCDCLVVRAKIEVDPITAALTVTSDTSGPYRIPAMLEGIPLQIQHINVTINHSGFTFNPTNCSKMAITGDLTSTEGATDALSLPFQVTNCSVLGFKPGFQVATQAKTSRKDGASLTAKLTYPNVGGHAVLASGLANIAKVKVELPKQLPARLSTLQKACTERVFTANPASCPPASKIGYATARTPVLGAQLAGPAYFVSNGSAKFPELIIVLQGDNVTVDLHGETFISKAGITSSTFATVPDVPVGTFELTLPEGPDSALGANANLCKTKLVMPTEFLAQNGAQIKQNTKIAVTGCPKAAKVKAKKHKKAKSKHHKK